MQAHITADGTLEVRAETPTEAYALRTWWEAHDGFAVRDEGARGPWPPASAMRCDWESCSPRVDPMHKSQKYQPEP